MTVPFALSIHKFITSVGADVGFASIIAVAILVLLYFAHSRETATLRERLDEAQQRIGGLEARIAQLMQMQAGAPRGRAPGPGTPAPGAPGPVAPAPAPAPARPGAPVIPSVRRVPNPATAAAAAGAPAPAAAGMAARAGAAARPAAAPGAPAGLAAPALASATKLIPDAVNGAPDDTMFVPAPVAAAVNGRGGGEQAALPPAPAPARQTAAASARVASASPRGAVAAPRAQLAPDREDDGASDAGRGIRRIGAGRRPAAAPPIGSLLDDPSEGGRFSGRFLPLLIGAVAVIVIIAGLVVITNAGGGTTTGQVSHGNTAQTGATLHKQQQQAAVFHASSFTVAVLNGTAQAGLAGDVGKRIAADGYRKGNITNASSQTQALTFVYYMPGKDARANRTAADHVARTLSLAPTRVRRAGAGVIQSCTISASGASLGSCRANVIVSVGQDRVNIASGGTAG